MHKAFLLRLPLISPLVMSVYGMTGDAMVGGALFEQTDDGDLVEKLECLTHREGIACASGIMIERPYRILTRGVGHSFTRDLMLTPDIRLADAPKPTVKGIETSRHGFRNVLAYYEAIETAAVWCAMHGDPDTVVEICRRAMTIGALRQKGGGHLDVDSIDAHVLPNPTDRIGLCDRRGAILRPVPVETAIKLSIAGHHIAHVAYRNPYRSSPKAVCYVPARQELFVSRLDLRERFS